MAISVFLMVLVAVSLVLDIVKDLDLTPIAVLFSIMSALIFGVGECIYAVLALPVKYIVYTVTRKNIIKALGMKHVITPFIQPSLYIISGVSIGFIAQKLSIIPLDLWPARVLFITCIYLALTLTVFPSLDALTTPVKLLLVDVVLLSKITYVLAAFLGTICVFYLLQQLGLYMVIPFTIAGVLWFYRKKMGFLWKYITPISFFISVIILAIVLGIK